MNNLCYKIGLGTAQWGMSYGIANLSGQPEETEIRSMLLHARQTGVTILDTAYIYGEAEKILGEQNACSLGFEIVTKTMPIQGSMISGKDVESVSSGFMDSLERLKSESVYGLLIHTANNLLDPGGNLLWEKLQELKAKKRVSKVGVSVYHPQQLEEILSRYEIDLAQLPCNIYDQRFIRSGLLQRLKQEGIEIHGRSVFLQGLLLIKPDDLPEQFGAIRNHQTRFHNDLRDSELTPLEGSLGFCLNQRNIDRIIVGCETVGQLMQILSIARKSHGSPPNSQSYAINDERVVDPSKWLN